MVNYFKWIFSVMLLMFFSVRISYADVGEMGFFCGVSEGVKIPKVMDKYVGNTDSENAKKILRYKEVVFITGKPLVFQGNLEINKSGQINDKDDYGTYSETYSVVERPSSGIIQDLSIERKIVFNVDWRRVDNQILKNYELATWEDKIEIGDKAYILNEDESEFNNTIIEYNSPGIKYYKGSIGYKAVYTSGEETVTMNVTGSNALYGYDQAWGKTETQLLDVYLESSTGWKLEAEVKPSVTINKTMKYDENRPSAIGFGGNYLQVTRNSGGLKYNITVRPSTMDYSNRSGNLSVPAFSTFEHLVAPSDAEYLKGSFAEEDIKKLYSLEVLDNRFRFIPNEQLTRAQYITLIVKSLGLEEEVDIDDPENNIFSDVDKYHPHFKNIVVGFDKKIILGTSKGRFNPDRPINREEAFVIYMRALGLSRLGLSPSPITPFVDDNEISDWAKKDVYALYNIGLIKGDPTGKLRPKSYITKAEGAAIINRLVDYLRVDIEKDYIEKLTQY